MLVRVDLFTQLGGFDPDDLPRRRRPRSLLARPACGGAGARGAGRARRAPRGGRGSAASGDRPERSGAGAAPACACSSRRTRCSRCIWLVPVGIVVGFIEALGALVTGHPRAARAALTGWFSNLFHFRRLRSSRKRAQTLRHVHDRELRELQIGSATRLATFFSHHMHTDERLRSFGDREPHRSRHRVGSHARAHGVRAVRVRCCRALRLAQAGHRRGAGNRHARTVAGSRRSVQRVRLGVAIHGSGIGSPAPFLLALMGAFGTVLFGAVGFAAHRLGRRRDAARGLRRVPVHPQARRPARACVRRRHRLRREPGRPRRDRNRALRSARALRAVAVRARTRRATVRARSRRARSRRRRDPPSSENGAARRSRAGGSSDSRCSSRSRPRVIPSPPHSSSSRPRRSCSPPRSPADGGGRCRRARYHDCRATIAAVVLLFPWPLAYATSHLDAASLGFAFRPDLESLRRPAVPVGSVGAGWAMWGLLVAAAVPLFVATGRAPCVDGTRLGPRGRRVGDRVGARAGRAASGRSSRRKRVSPSPRSGSRSHCGIGVSVLVDGIRTFRFGWRQPAAILGGVALLLPILGFTADAFDGRWLRTAYRLGRFARLHRLAQREGPVPDPLVG